MNSIPAIPAVAVPMQNNPVVLEDVSNGIEYRRNASRKRKAEPAVVTEDMEARATIHVTSKSAGDEAALAWYTPAVKEAMIAAIVRALEPLHLSATRLQNSSAVQPHHVLAVPPGPIIPGFPTTLKKLVKLSAANVKALEVAYHLPPAAKASLRQRRQAIATYLGLQVTV